MEFQVLRQEMTARVHRVQASSAGVERLVGKKRYGERQSIPNQSSSTYKMMWERSCREAREGQGPKKGKPAWGNGAGGATEVYRPPAALGSASTCQMI